MSDIKAFTTLLEQTVAAPRLSGSKVQALTALSQNLATQNLDTDLVTTFYRINAGLSPASQGRISSLYVFDAIARGARKDADKERDKGKAKEGRGMTGLISKMEGVVDAWVGGMIDDGKGGMWVEGKDKVRKVLDIWTKGSTFPAPTLDRLQAKISNADAGPSRQASSNGGPQAGRSTTPPGDPPAPAFSPVLPPLNVPGGVPGMNLTAPAKSSTPPTDPAAAQNLPPEILKLLGMQAGAVGTSTTTPPPQTTPSVAGSVDIAALLASVRPQPVGTASAAQPAVQAILSPYNTQTPVPAGFPATSIPTSTPPLPFGLDPRQLAALASLGPTGQPGMGGQTPPQDSPGPGAFPPIGIHGPPGPGQRYDQAGPSYPQRQYPGPGGPAGPGGPESFPPFPPGDRYQYGPGPDYRDPPRRGSYGRSPPYHGGDNLNRNRGQYSPPSRYNDRGDWGGGGPGYGYDARDDRNGRGGPPPRVWDQRDRGRDDGRPPRWDDRRDSRQNVNGYPGPGRPRSRSPEFRDGGGPPRDGSGSGGGGGGFRRQDNGYGNRAGNRPGHGSTGSFDGPNFDGERERDRNDRPGVRKNYGGFKNQSGRFDPPPPPPPPSGLEGLPPNPQMLQAQQGGRAPLPPGRDEDGGRAPPPPGRDMGDSAPSAADTADTVPIAVGTGDEEDMALDNSDDENVPSPQVNKIPSIQNENTPAPTQPVIEHTIPSPTTEDQMPMDMGMSFGPRLETFDVTTFNPMMPDSWAVLATAYKNTTGREPSQMDLMGFLAGQGPVMPMMPMMGGGGGGINHAL